MVFFGLFSESGTLGDSCTSMRLRQGVLLSFLYVVFRFSASICYSSIRFPAIALYDLAPGSLRLYLIRCFRSQTLPKEVRRYRRTG